jgi:hypothetical protein
MAKLNFNPWLDDVRGTYGRLVFKQHYGRMIVARKPALSGLPPTEPQVRQRERFAAANKYATAVLADAGRRAPYVEAAKARNVNPFGLAMGDFLNLPEVKEIDLAEYFGRVGDPIKITAVDDFGLVAVKVTIRNEAGTTLEQGLATEVDDRWVYRATTVAPSDQTLTIEAEAKDRPGHERARSETWHA